jgi:ABC-2 type transport system permease protein
MVASLAFMLSALVDSSLGPIIMTMSIIIVFMIVSSIDLSIFRAVKPYMFTTYMGAWREFFSDPVDWNKVYKATIALTSHILIFLGFTILYFKKKDILT